MTDTNQSVPPWRAIAPPGISLSEAMMLAGAAPAARPLDPGRGLADALLRSLRPGAMPRWRSTRVSQMTPQRVEWVLEGALGGDLQAQWELLDLMEDTWPRLAKNLAEVRRGVAAMKWTVRPWAGDGEEPSDAARSRAALVSHVLWRMRPDPAAGEQGFTGLITDLMDAWSKGVSVLELLWEERDDDAHGPLAALRAYQWVPPTYYGVNDSGKLGLMIDGSASIIRRSEASPPAMIDPPPYKFLIGLCPARSSHWSGAALLRPLAWWWAAHSFAAEWALNHAQLFGVPIRWASHPRGADEALVSEIGRFLAQMGSAGWATFPEGTDLHLHEPQRGGGASPQEAIMDRADRYCDLLILGQTLTSDPGDRGTQALGTVHEHIRADRLQAAADWVAGVLTQQLVPMILELNYGDANLAPELRAEPVTATDWRALAERDRLLLDAGVPLPRAWFYERHDIPIPGAGEPVVQRAGALTPVSGAAAAEPPPPAPTDEIAARKAAALAEAYRGALAPVADLIRQARSPQEAIAAVAAHFRDWRPAKVVELTEEALSLAAATGAADALAASRPRGSRG